MTGELGKLDHAAVSVRNDGKGKHNSFEANVLLEVSGSVGASWVTLNATAWGESEQEARQMLARVLLDVQMELARLLAASK